MDDPVEPDVTYEGWKNWHTWHTALLLDNIYPYYLCYLDCMYKHGFFRAGTAKAFVAGLFQRKFKGVEMDHADEDSDYYTDLNKVDWQEIARHLNTNFKDHPKGNRSWLNQAIQTARITVY